MQLVIAEKPSVAMSIAAVIGANERKDGYAEGNGYVVSWCVGHLVGLADASHYGDYKKWKYDDLPILPGTWETVTAKDKKEQFDILKNLMEREDITNLVEATDAGREGELIFRLVYEKAGCKKPFKRLWISSMEESAIRAGFDDLKDGREYDALYHSALCRAKADWLVGINATRLFSVLYNHTLNVGRVQTPTLSLIVERSDAIEHFKSKKTYSARITDGTFTAQGTAYENREDAEKAAASANGQEATCAGITREEKTENPPKLFDLTALQREANRLYGYTAKQTLDYTQSLYEKKLCTYPRTDSRYLTDDMRSTAESLVSGLLGNLSYTQGLDLSPDFACILNSQKVSDHHAIIPTAGAISVGENALPEGEKNILSLLCMKLLCAVAPLCVTERVRATFSCAGETFTAKGTTVKCAGFKEIEARYKAAAKNQPEDKDTDDEKMLPQLSEGQTFTVSAEVSEHESKAPVPYTEDTLLSAMERAGNADMTEEAERKGLGTPATRAAVIEKLVQAGFMERKGKQLLPTADGKNLVSLLPEKLTSPKLTAEWENELTRIAKGTADPEDFMRRIESMVTELVQTHTNAPEDKQSLFTPAKEEIGKCPRCNSPVYEGKKNFYCSNRECSFAIWKNDRFFERKRTTLTKREAAALLSKGRVSMKGLYSEKTGKTYDADIILADTGDKYVNYKTEIIKADRPKPKKK